MKPEKLDRRLGKWLLHKVHDFTPAPYSTDSVKTAVVFIPRLIGDGMATFPVIRALQKRRIPRIIVIASQNNRVIFEPLSTNDELQVISIPGMQDKEAIKQVAKHIKQEYGRIDLCIDASLKDNTSSITFVGTLKARNNLQMSGSPMRCFAPVCERASAMYENDESVPVCWAALMHDAGIADVPGQFELPVPDTIGKEVSTWLQQQGLSKYIVLNLDGSTHDKKLSAQKGEQVAQLVNQHYGLPLVVICSPSGEFKVKELVQRCPFVILPELPRSLHHSAALVEHAALVVSPDTAIVHIASAHNIPVIGIYRRPNGHWVPMSNKNAVVIAGSPIENVTASQIKQAFDQVNDI